jgi:hypothetical protein
MRWRIKLLAFAVVAAGAAMGPTPARAWGGGPVYCCKSEVGRCCGTGGCTITNSGCTIIGQPVVISEE